MKVKELIKILQSEDPELEVMLQRDPEGNGYSPLYGWWTGSFDKTWSEAGEEHEYDNPTLFLVPSH